MPAAVSRELPLGCCKWLLSEWRFASIGNIALISEAAGDGKWFREHIGPRGRSCMMVVLESFDEVLLEVKVLNNCSR